MQPWLVVVLILVVGLGLVTAATLADRRSARGRLTNATSPGPEPANDLPPPEYVTPDELLASAPAATKLTPEQERELADQLSSSGTTKLDLGLAADTLATHTGRRAVLDRPMVLVCPDRIDDIREIMRLLGAAVQDRRPLVIAAHAITAQTLETVIVNRLDGRLEVAVLLGEPGPLAQLARATATQQLGFADRQAGLPPISELGHCDRIVADCDQCWVISSRALTSTPESP